MKINQYEAMFLLENNAANADFEATAGQVDEILTKHGLTLVQKEKWDERKLAYEIKGQRRATYYLVYCEGPTTAMDPIEEDLHLNEVVLRFMFLRLDEPIAGYVEKRAKEREALAEDSRRNSLSGWGDRRGKRKPGGREGGSSTPGGSSEGASSDGAAKDAVSKDAVSKDGGTAPAKPEGQPEVANKEEAASS